MLLFPLDDAYITLHNARVLLTGFDPNYGVPALLGATSPIHLFLVAALGVALPLPIASLAINVAAALIYGAGLWALSGLGGASRLVRGLLVAVGLAAALPHLINGLETGLALAGVAWSLVLAAGDSRVKLPLLLGLLPFIRPDLAPLSAVLMVWRAWSAGCAASDWRIGARRLAGDGALALIAAAPWLTWTWLSLGVPLPTTMMAKRAFFAEEALPLAVKARMVLLAILSSLLAPLLVAIIAAPRASLAKPIWAFMLIFIAAYTETLPGGLAHNSYRYMALIVPLCLYPLSFAAARREWAAVLGLSVLLEVFVVAGAARLARFYPVTSDGMAAAEWARDNLPRDARVLVHDAGIPAWMTSLRLVDVVGLKSPASIAAHLALTAPTAGRDREEAVSGIALASGANYAIVLDNPFWRQIGEDLRGRGWGLVPLRTPPSGHGYTIYALTPPPMRTSAGL